MFYENNITTN